MSGSTPKAIKPPLPEPRLDRVVNIATVRHLSPFRYPGGKTWLVPHIRRWLRFRPDHFIEPFAGGGIIGLTVASEKLAGHVTMVELDDQVAAVWKTILSHNEADWLVDRIMNFDLSLDSLREELAGISVTIRDKAFQTILKNRTYHGGILAAGSAPVRYGENGKGIKSRWYAETLKKRILAVAALSERITFIEGDGLKVINENAHRRDAAFFIDPPYTASGKRAGRRLYTHYELNHEELFDCVASVAGDFLMTYDDAKGVRELARKRNFDTELVVMKNTHHARMTELLIGRDLDWARLRLDQPD